LPARTSIEERKKKKRDDFDPGPLAVPLGRRKKKQLNFFSQPWRKRKKKKNVSIFSSGPKEKRGRKGIPPVGW